MTRKPIPLTVAEHQALGARLAALTREIEEIGWLLAERCPAKITRRWRSATNPLVDLRFDLEELLIAQAQLEGCDDGQVPRCYIGRKDA